MNYFNTTFGSTADAGTLATYTVGEKTLTISPIVSAIRGNITSLYVVCRMIALIMQLLILIYIGINMATSSVADDKVKYKRMFMGWLESFIILVLLPYIMAFIAQFGESITNIFYNIETQILNGQESFEDAIGKQFISVLIEKGGLVLTLYSIMYLILFLTQLKFFWMYAKRVLMVAFLIMISPLITITYSIDKMGDGKAQAFSAWFKEYTVNVLIQPLHALIYMVFVLTAGKIAETAPIVASSIILYELEN